MTTRRILGTSGGLVEGPVQMSWRLGTMLKDALALTGKTRPRVCLVNTAMGDNLMYYAISYEAFNEAGCDVTEMKVYPQPSANPEERLCGSDLVWVGGGSVANLLALWRLHGIDDAMRSAWEQGVILGGVSAGSLCWHMGGTTDSFGPILQPVTNALGFLPYANGVHYDAEAQRRPLLQKLMKEQVLGSLAYATDNTVGVWYEGIEATTVVSDSDVDPTTGPAAYKVEFIDGDIIETRFGVGSTFA
jgi:peptidase E